MKLTIKRAEFLKMLTFAAQAIPGKTAESQYMNFLLVVSQDALDVITSDGSITSKIHKEREDEELYLRRFWVWISNQTAATRITPLTMNCQ